MFVAYKFKPHAECYLRNESVMFFIESSTALTTISQEKREVRGQLQDQAVQKTLRRQTVSGALNHKSTVGHLSTLISISLRHTFLTVALWFLIPDTLSESLRESHASLSEAKSAHISACFLEFSGQIRVSTRESLMHHALGSFCKLQSFTKGQKNSSL